jgi:hypothetical protein
MRHPARKAPVHRHWSCGADCHQIDRGARRRAGPSIDKAARMRLSLFVWIALVARIWRCGPARLAWRRGSRRRSKSGLSMLRRPLWRAVFSIGKGQSGLSMLRQSLRRTVFNSGNSSKQTIDALAMLVEDGFRHREGSIRLIDASSILTEDGFQQRELVNPDYRCFGDPCGGRYSDYRCFADPYGGRFSGYRIMPGGHRMPSLRVWRSRASGLKPLPQDLQPKAIAAYAVCMLKNFRVGGVSEFLCVRRFSYLLSFSNYLLFKSKSV